MCLCLHVEGKGQPWLLFQEVSPIVFETGSLSGTWGSLIQLGLLTIKHQNLSVFSC